MESQLKFIYNKNIFRVWRGYGSAIFLELGEPIGNEGKGESTLCISECGWEICEGDKTVLVGGDDFSSIDAYLRRLEGLSIWDVRFAQKNKSWVFCLDNGTYIYTYFEKITDNCHILFKNKADIMDSTGKIKTEVQND